jgi:hypothetical protein
MVPNSPMIADPSGPIVEIEAQESSEPDHE